MKFKKIIKYFTKKIKNRKKRNNNNIVLSKNKNANFKKKRRSISINNKHLNIFKIFWTNLSRYYALIVILFLGLWIYLIIWPIFKTKNIEIIKQDNITNMIIAYKAVDTYRWKSIFAAEKADVLWRLQDYQHNVRDINIDLVLPDTLKIIIDSYKWIFNTTINDKTFLITENGTLIPSVYSTDLKELVVINNFDKNKYIDYKKTFDTEYIEKIYKIIELLEENIINLEISDLEYYLVEREIHITVDEYTIIIFDLDWEFKEQIEKIAIFNKDYLDINNKTIIYIDLRIKNKVFYCTSENEFQCMENLKSVYWLE